MSNSTTTINFKLQVAPGAIESFSVGSGSVDELDKKLDEFGLNLDNVYMKNPKGSLVPLRRRLDCIQNGDQIKLFGVVSDSDGDSGESSDSGDDQVKEIVIIGRSGGRRDRSRSRGNRDRSRSRSRSRGKRDRSRSRSHSHERKKCHGKKFLKHLSKKVDHHHRYGVELPNNFGCGFGGFGGFKKRDKLVRHGVFGGVGRRCDFEDFVGPESPERVFDGSSGPRKFGRHGIFGGFGGWEGPRRFEGLGKPSGFRQNGFMSS